MKNKAVVLASVITVAFLAKNSSGELKGLADGISDLETRVELARLYATQPDHLQHSYELYLKLMAESPLKPTFLEEFADLCLKMNRPDDAIRLLNAYTANLVPAEADKWLFTHINLLTTKGDTRTALQTILSTDPARLAPEQQLELSRQLELYGSFYRAERIYRQLPPDIGELPLIKLLISTGRFEEADWLLESKPYPDENWGLVHLQSLTKQKRFTKAENLANELQHQYPASMAVDLAHANLLFELGDYKNASIQYQEVETRNPLPSLLGRIRSARKLELYDTANALLDEALGKYPNSISLQCEQLQLDGHIFDTEPVETLLATDLAPAALIEWAHLYTSAGAYENALRCADVAADRYPDFWQARFAQTEINGIAGNWHRAIELIDELLLTAPNNYQLLLNKARFLSWSKEYDQALQCYSTLHSLNDANPIPLRERARTCFWAKDIDEGASTFGMLLSPSVDQQLLDALDPYAEIMDNEIAALRQSVDDKQVWQGYESFRNHYMQRINPVAGIQSVLHNLEPSYLIQKGADLERQTFILNWNRRLSQALSANEELAELYPANAEVLFNLAQMQCSLRLCDDVQETYKKLLDYYPSHSIAPIALEKAEIYSNPALRFDVDHWHENGRGELSGIERYRWDYLAEFPIHCRYRPYIKAIKWWEDPDQMKLAQANGLAVGAFAPFSPWLKANGELAYKNYEFNRYEDYLLGNIELWGNLNDYAWIGAGYERKEELSNRFALEDQTRMDRYWLGAKSDLTHWVNADMYSRWKKYNDENSGYELAGSLGWKLTDHPREFKLIFAGEYRDTEHENIYIYSGDTLDDIIYPYWTPQNYYGGTLLVEWRHDLAQQMFCGNYQHFYDIKIGYGMGSDDNHGWMAEAEWMLEFKKHWATGIRGYLNDSQEWNADAAHAFLQYRF